MATSAALFVWVGRAMTGAVFMVIRTAVGTTGLHVIRAYAVLVGAAAVVVTFIVCSCAIAASILEGRRGGRLLLA